MAPAQRESFLELKLRRGFRSVRATVGWDTPPGVSINMSQGNRGRSGGRGPGRGRGRGRGGRPPRKVTEAGEEKAVEVEGTITSVLAGTQFRVQLPSGHEVLAHISGKMRKRFIRLVVGDKVKMEMSPYDVSKARITYRLG